MRTRGARFAGLTAAMFVTVTGIAAAAPLDASMSLVIGAGAAPRPPLVANGATVSVSSLDFGVAAVVENTGPDTAGFRLRFELAPGLAWGTDGPDDDEGCTSTATAAECAPPRELRATEGFGWFWDVRAASAGSYVVRATIVSTSVPDPNTTDNSSSATVVVAPSAPRPTATALTITPRRPRAGAVVAVRSNVRRAGEALTPTSLRCSGRIGRSSVRGAPDARAGAAVCRYRTRAAHRGRTLHGTMTFGAGGSTFTRRFSVKLR